MKNTDAPNGTGLLEALKQGHGRRNLDGSSIDTRGTVAILEARKRGITDPDELRRIARAAKA